MKKTVFAVICAVALAFVAIQGKRKFEKGRLTEAVARKLLSPYPEPIKISPDGRTILLKTRHLDDFELFLKDVSTGSLRSIDRTAFTQLSLTWLPAGDALLYQAYDPRARALFLHEVELKTGARKKTPFPRSQSAMAPLRWSPNGKHLAYFVDGSPSFLGVFDYGRGTMVTEWRDTDRQSDFQWKNDSTVTMRAHSDPGMLVNVSLDGASVDKLSLAPGGEVQEFAWNKEGNLLAASVRQKDENFLSLVLYSARTKKTAKLFSSDWDVRRPEFISGKSTLAFHENKQGLRCR